MTSEEYKKEIFGEPSSTKVYKSAKKYIKSLEAQLKAKDEEIAKYQIAIDKQSKRCEALKQFAKPDGFPRDCFGNIEIT